LIYDLTTLPDGGIQKYFPEYISCIWNHVQYPAEYDEFNLFMNLNFGIIEFYTVLFNNGFMIFYSLLRHNARKPSHMNMQSFR